MKEIRIPFKGWDLVTFINEKDGDTMVAVRPIAEAIGVDWGSQWRKIQKDPRFMCSLMTSHDSTGRKQEMFCLPVKQLNGWLYGINANRVKVSIRPKLLAFQEECHMAIHHHMNGSVSKEVVDALYKIIEQQQITINRLELNAKQQGEQLIIHNRMLGLEASVAGKRLAAARHLKIVP